MAAPLPLVRARFLAQLRRQLGGCFLAGVFLSYARDDSDKARAIALALEKAGHSVWWDSRIEGGAEYGREIEQALQQSGAVVVLWSKASAASAWVRDEAAAGRDRGLLVPVRLDETDPPMGFRQYQSIDLIGWTGRGKPPKLKEIGSAIDRLADGQSRPPDKLASRSVSSRSVRLKAGWAATAALVFAAAAALVVWRPWSVDARPFVSVKPADQSSSAKILAGDLLIKLSSLQSTEADALRLVEPGSKADPDFTFKVGSTGGMPAARANLTLVDQDGVLLWSREFAQPGGNEADLRQQVAYSAGQVLECATEALAPNHPKLEPSVLGLYLKGCADLSTTSDTRMAIPAFLMVTEKAPRFAGGWGKLLIAELEAFKATGMRGRELQDDLRRHAAEAGNVNRELAEIYLVQSWLQPPRPILRWMRLADEALARKPDNAAILENHAIGLGHFGRMRDAVEDARRATEVEPLSPGARQTLISFLADSEAYQAARQELNEAERLWPGASNIRRARFWFEYRYGNPKNALALLESGGLGFSPDPAQTNYLRARIEGSPESIDLAISDARRSFEQEGNIYQYIQTLAAFGRKEEAIQVLLSADPALAPGVISAFFRPALKDVRRDVRFMTIARRYGLVDYWTATARWPDYCLESGLSYDCKKEAAKPST